MGLTHSPGPAFGTVVFAAVVVAPVVTLVPWGISGWRVLDPIVDGDASRWFGALLVTLGLPIWMGATLRFVRNGRGTPAPIAPPENLVVAGLYRYVRNPMYIGVLAMIVGQGLILGSWGTLLYAAILAAAFHLFVVFYEEPTLGDRFGAEYAAYCRAVPRWLPRWRQPPTSGTGR